jgi:hypothetical protein
MHALFSFFLLLTCKAASKEKPCTGSWRRKRQAPFLSVSLSIAASLFFTNVIRPQSGQLSRTGHFSVMLISPIRGRFRASGLLTTVPD